MVVRYFVLSFWGWLHTVSSPNYKYDARKRRKGDNVGHRQRLKVHVICVSRACSTFGLAWGTKTLELKGVCIPQCVWFLPEMDRNQKCATVSFVKPLWKRAASSAAPSAGKTSSSTRAASQQPTWTNDVLTQTKLSLCSVSSSPELDFPKLVNLRRGLASLCLSHHFQQVTGRSFSLYNYTGVSLVS